MLNPALHTRSGLKAGLIRKIKEWITGLANNLLESEPLIDQTLAKFKL